MTYIFPILFIQVFVTVAAYFIYRIYHKVKYIRECLDADNCDYGAEEETK